MFNEDSLRADVVSIWGEHGAHVDVLDELIRRAHGLGAGDVAQGVAEPAPAPGSEWPIEMVARTVVWLADQNPNQIVLEDVLECIEWCRQQ